MGLSFAVVQIRVTRTSSALTLLVAEKASCLIIYISNLTHIIF